MEKKREGRRKSRVYLKEWRKTGHCLLTLPKPYSFSYEDFEVNQLTESNDNVRSMWPTASIGIRLLLLFEVHQFGGFLNI